MPLTKADLLERKKMVAIRTNNYQHIEVKPFAPNLGADVYGVDLSKPVPDDHFADILSGLP
jgi:taurine dioxygenase